MLGTALGLGFAAGLRLYATVLLVGAAVRWHWIALPDNLKSLEVLAHPAILITAGVAFVIEFVNDKIPWLDSLWDSIHTFIRPVGAAALGLAAFADVDPVFKTILVLAMGGVALTSHATKSATRLAANTSPEPFSNIGLSLAGDLAVPGIVWLTTTHPVVALAIVAVALIVFVIVLRWILRTIREGWTALKAHFSTLFA